MKVFSGDLGLRRSSDSQVNPPQPVVLDVVGLTLHLEQLAFQVVDFIPVAASTIVGVDKVAERG